MPSHPIDKTSQVVIAQMAPRYSVVIPVYGNAGTIRDLVTRLQKVAEQLAAPMEAVFVVDGSPDNSLDLLREELASANLLSRVVIHSRNFGSFPAIRMGFALSRGEYIGVMAADLQEPPELMTDFFSTMENQRVDVVVGRREGRNDPGMSTMLSRTFWAMYRRLVLPEIPRGGVDVFGCTRRVADRLLELNESHSSLVALLYWVGYKRVEVPYKRLERTVGKSGWTMKKKLGYLSDSVFAFTDLPIVALTTVGVLGSITTVVVSIIVLISRLVGGIEYPGYTALMLVMLFSTFLTLGGLGIVGSYVYRTFENSKNRPISIAMTVEDYNGGR